MQDICIVIPCYNEEHRLPVKEFYDYCSFDDSTFFCFVNDGSKDKTIEILNKLKSQWPEKIFIVDLPANSGKAEAVRQGMMQSVNRENYDFIGFMDADLATPLSEISNFRQHIKDNPDCTLFLGSRIKRLGSKVERSVIRHYFGRVFATFASVILSIGVYDTQCGAKLFHKSIVKHIFADKFFSKWLFDIEFIFRAINYYGKETAIKKMVEVPLQTWIEKGASKVSPLYIIKVPYLLLKIRSYYRIKKR